MLGLTARGHSEWYKFDGIHPNKNGENAVATTVYNFLK